MAIGRLIAKALLEGKDVHVAGFGTFRKESPSAALHEHEQHRIWTAPRDEVRFEAESTTTRPSDSGGAHV